jgi:hypothetical protein
MIYISGQDGHQVSSSCGDFSTASTSLVDVTNLTVTITTNGGPVMLGLNGESDSASSGTLSYFRANVALGEMTIDRSGTDISTTLLSVATGTTDFYSPGAIMLDTPSVGTYTYKIQVKQTSGSGSVQFRFLKLYAYELA